MSNQYQNETKNCQNCKNDFTIEPDDFSFYEKIKVPPPTFCPECRMIRRFHFRNEGMLFRRTDGHNGKEIFSGISPEANVTTYNNDFWFGDNWDPMKFGQEYNFNKPFFEQFKELLARAPIPARSAYNMINSDYCNEASHNKNCYLCFNTDYIENSAYLRKVRYIKDSFDMYEGIENELCYEDVMVDKSYQTFFSFDCESCVDVWFSKGLRGCTNCFGCVNLTNKSHYFFNEQFSKEEYDKKVKEFVSGSYIELSKMRKKVSKFWNEFPNKFYHGLRITNSTGERLFDVKNVKNSYSVREGENLRYCQDMQSKASNSYDYSIWGDRAENMYECVTCGLGCYDLQFCFNSWGDIKETEYSGYCFGSSNLFGCVSLSKKKFCILNKQYSEEEYYNMVEKIKKHMNDMPYVDNKRRAYKYGEFFPFNISPIAYNESMANDFFPIDEVKANDKGYTWREIKNREYETNINAEDLPDNIDDVNESITEKVIKCLECQKAFRFIKIEFQFYKRFNLSLPRFCHNCRFIERFKLVNPPKFWPRTCMCDKENHNNHPSNSSGQVNRCEVEFETSYAPDRPEIVYCEKCYQQEVY